MKDKYLVLKYDDIQKLHPQYQQTLLQIVQSLNALREQMGKQPPVYFVLHMEDVYAQPAIEAYIEAIQNDVPANRRQSGVQAALQAAQARKELALMTRQQRLPS